MRCRDCSAFCVPILPAVRIIGAVPRKQISIETVVQVPEEPIAVRMIPEHFSEGFMGLGQETVPMQTGQVPGIQGRVAIGVTAVEEELNEDDACQKVMDDVVCQSPLVKLRTREAQILEQQRVRASISSETPLVTLNESATGKLQPVESLIRLRGQRSRPSVAAFELVACIGNLRRQYIDVVFRGRGFATGKP